jgi:hypothetical protein
MDDASAFEWVQAVAGTVAAAVRLALLDRHLERVCRERGGRVLADRPADRTAAERVEHDGAVHLALTGRMLRDAEVHPEASRRRG